MILTRIAFRNDLPSGDLRELERLGRAAAGCSSIAAILYGSAGGWWMVGHSFFTSLHIIYTSIHIDCQVVTPRPFHITNVISIHRTSEPQFRARRGRHCDIWLCPSLTLAIVGVITFFGTSLASAWYMRWKGKGFRSFHGLLVFGSVRPRPWSSWSSVSGVWVT
jgi:hypothetical protein